MKRYIDALKVWLTRFNSMKVFIEFVATMVALGKIVVLMLKRLPEDRKLRELVQLKVAMQDAHRTKSTHKIKDYMMKKFR